MSSYNTLIDNQRSFFLSGKTLSYSYRKQQLKKLEQAIIQYTPQIEQAIYSDFKKCAYEVYLTEIVMSLSAVKKALHHVKKWSKPQKIRSSIFNFPSKDYIIKEPYGIALIISPWNYPFLLAVSPLIAALAAGNCVVIKPSELAPATSALLEKMITEIFPPEYVSVLQGDVEMTDKLLQNRFDKIFFTGSSRVGKVVMQAASTYLTPVTLELGGKSPCIVTPTANLEVAAKRLIWGKMVNAGQTCIAPDYLWVHNSIKDQFLLLLKETIHAFYGTDIRNNPDYPRIINEKNYIRLCSFLQSGTIVCGGDIDQDRFYISPTLMEDVTWNDLVMQEEIFGPILPILTYSSIDEVIQHVNHSEKPLALYLFSTNREEIKKVKTLCHYGGGCINDTLSHISNENLPFGGVGNSGMGAYHGKWGFMTFSHLKSITHRKNYLDITLRYPPYKGKLEKIKKIIRFW